MSQKSSCRRLSSSVVKKQVMGITGLMLCGFLVSHLITNSLMYVSGELFNTAAHALITNPLIIPAEIILGLVFLSHIGLAIKLTLENRSARPEAYYMKRKPTGRGATFASSTMIYTGLIVLVFLILHILEVKFGPEYLVTYNGVEMRDLYKLLIEIYSNPIVVIWYVFAVCALGIHVSHGLWSAFQSIGFNHPRYTPLLQKIAKVYAVVIAVGFSALPIYCYLQGVN